MSLILNDISHRYGETLAVDGARLEAAPGEIVCLFGPSGCGKTTLLRLAAGLERVQEGAVTLDGAALSGPHHHAPPEDRRIGLVFQDYVLFPHLTVAQNIAFGLQGLGGKERRTRIAEELAGADLEGFEDRYPHMLSGGQQQRAALARAFARRPRAMLLDEPFASIDAVRRRRLREGVRRMLKNHEAATILVTHDPEEALAMGDRIAIMREGRLIETATPQVLYKGPQTPEGAAMFPGAQTISGTIRNGRLHTAFGETATPDATSSTGAVTAVVRSGVVAAAAAADGQGPAEIVDCRFEGPGWRILLQGQDGETLLTESVEPMALGVRAKAIFDPAALYLFDKPDTQSV